MGTALSNLLKDGDPAASGLSLSETIADCDVVADYSHPAATATLLESLRDCPRALLVGTTGLQPKLLTQLRTFAQSKPVVLAPNTGTGITVLAGLLEHAVKALGPGWDIEVLEMHHRAKVDAPSGTAWMLLERAAAPTSPQAARGLAQPVRLGQTGARSDQEIGIQSLRGGDVVGEHTVYLVGHGERIELTHRCWDRNSFARGGLRAARWLGAAERSPGLYSMDDVLSC
tara:strand:+ start:789 stop:1475 length:687 start_codon:yes stop_codon:yes gene_type:complete